MLIQGPCGAQSRYFLIFITSNLESTCRKFFYTGTLSQTKFLITKKIIVSHEYCKKSKSHFEFEIVPQPVINVKLLKIEKYASVHLITPVKYHCKDQIVIVWLYMQRGVVLLSLVHQKLPVRRSKQLSSHSEIG